MPTIEVKKHLEAPIQQVWSLISDLEGYPLLMDPVKKLEVIDRHGNELTARWEVELKGSILRWVEREIHDPARYRIDFNQIEGDLERFEGYWQLRPVGDDKTEASLQIRFEIGIPMLKDMLDPVASRALTENAHKMLTSLTAKEATPPGGTA